VSDPRRLRELLHGAGIVVAPGAYDAITARLVQRAGFPAVYMTGAVTAAAIGYPDYGLVTQTEMAQAAERLVAAVDVPVIADADTGYGNQLNVVRTVREYERRGVAGFHLEDQVFPKRCGHLDGKEVIPRDDYLRKIAAAVDARSDPDTVVIARTDALASLGFDEAIERLRRALALGADLAFMDAAQTREQIAAIPELVGGPCVHNLVVGGKGPLMDVPELDRAGYRLALVPGAMVASMLRAATGALDELGESGRHAGHEAPLPLGEIFELFGAREWDEIASRHSAPLTTTR